MKTNPLPKKIFPWQADQWQLLWQRQQKNCLPHALLFVGMAGIGKAQFADAFSQAILCRQSTATGVYCDTCHDCRIADAKSHPNILWITPEQTGQAIKIDQIRGVSEFAQQTALQGQNRIVVIHPANAMNAYAANALLKTLEEPSSGVYVILLSDQYSRLPATIVSRCQRLVFSRPDKALAMTWLKSQLTDHSIDMELLLNLAQGAPLQALRLVQNEILALRQDFYQALFSQKYDPVKNAEQWKEQDALQLLDFLVSWLIDLSRLQLTGSPDELVNKDYEKILFELSQRTVIKKNIDFLNYLQQLRRHLLDGINLNKQLLLEDMLVRWLGLMNHVSR